MFCGLLVILLIKYIAIQSVFTQQLAKLWEIVKLDFSIDAEFLEIINIINDPNRFLTPEFLENASLKSNQSSDCRNGWQKVVSFKNGKSPTFGTLLL